MVNKDEYLLCPPKQIVFKMSNIWTG